MRYARRGGTCAAWLATGVVLALGAVLSAQGELDRAKTLYVNAAYEEALTVLDRQATGAEQTGPRASEIQHYRALCLIALGRSVEADQAIALSVSADPFSVPDTSELAPRVASVFNEARARLIPDVARRTLAEGRELLQKGDPAAASRRFEAVTTLLSEPGLAGRADLSDLTMAATAFTELTKAQMAAAAAVAAAARQPVDTAEAAAPAATTGAGVATATSGEESAQVPSDGRQPPPAPRPGPGQVTTLQPPATDAAGFVPAVPVSQTVPPWQPGAGLVAQLEFSGAVRVTIDPDGHVTEAVMDPSVYPPYDRLVLAAAREWVYRPATRNGQPVASERLVEIVLRPRSER